MSLDIHNLECELDQLRDKEYISETTVDFFRDILRAQQKTKSILNNKNYTLLLTDDQIDNKLKAGTPLLSITDIPLDALLIKELFNDICEILQNQQNSDRETVQKVVAAQSSGALDLITLIEKLVVHDSDYFRKLCNKLEIREDILVFIALTMARPFFEMATSRIQKMIDKNKWLKNYCPACGSSAQISKIDKENGKRHLFCVLCGYEWRFARIKCAFCNNEDQKSLGFIDVKESSYRIHLCKKCMRYLKTLDERKAVDDKNVINPSIEDIATTYLDMLAEEKGYERSWFFPASVDQIKADEERKTVH